MGKFGSDLVCSVTETRFFSDGDALMKLEPMAHRKAIVQHLLIQRVLKLEAGGYGAVRPRNRSLHADKLLVPRESSAACLDFSL